MNKYIAQIVLNYVQENDFAEIKDGIYLATKFRLVADIFDCSDEDKYKHFNFTTCPYWVTGAGFDPIGIKDADDLIEFFESQE